MFTKTRVAILPFTLALLMCGLGPVMADLNNVPGLTDAQINAAAAVQTLCPQLAADQSGLTADQQDLLGLCSALVVTSNVQQNPSDPGAGGVFDLQITEAQLLGAIQNTNAEELAAQGTNATETLRGQSISNRLVALRAGAGGANISGLNISVDGYTVNASNAAAKLAAGAGYALMMENPHGDANGSGGGLSMGSERLGLFVNGSFSFGERDSSSAEPGFEFDVPGLTFGVDYRLNDNFVFGGLLGFEDGSTDFDVNVNVSGGNIDNQALSTGAYASYFTEKFYLDGTVIVGWNDYDINRSIVFISANPSIPTTTRTATADTDGVQFELSLSGGYEGSHKNFNYRPYGGFSSMSVRVDGYDETGAGGMNLRVGQQTISSFQANAGVNLSWNVSSDRMVMLPQVRVELIHEFQDEARNIDLSYVADPFGVNFTTGTDRPDRDFGLIGASWAAVLRGGIQAFVDIETTVGRKDLTNYVITLGGRFAI